MAPAGGRDQDLFGQGRIGQVELAFIEMLREPVPGPTQQGHRPEHPVTGLLMYQHERPGGVAGTDHQDRIPGRQTGQRSRTEPAQHLANGAGVDMGNSLWCEGPWIVGNVTVAHARMVDGDDREPEGGSSRKTGRLWELETTVGTRTPIRTAEW